MKMHRLGSMGFVAMLLSACGGATVDATADGAATSGGANSGQPGSGGQSVAQNGGAQNGGAQNTVAGGATMSLGGAGTGGSSNTASGGAGRGGSSPLTAAGGAGLGGNATTATAGKPTINIGGTSSASGGTAGAKNTVGGSAGATSAGTGGATTSTTGGNTSTQVCFDFNSDTDGWAKSMYARVPTATDPAVSDVALSVALQAAWSAEWMAGPGYGGLNGYVQFAIPFNATQISYQSVAYVYETPTAPLQLQGKFITAYVKLVSGLTPASTPSGAKLSIRTGVDYFYADGGWNNLSQGAWWKLSIDCSRPAMVDASKDPILFDPNDVREIAIEIDTSGAATTVATPGILMVDHICY